VVGVVIFATLPGDLGEWKRREDCLDDGGDLTSSTIRRPGGVRIGEGIGVRRSCSTNEGRVITDISSDGFELRSKVLPGWVTFLSEVAGEYRGGGWGCTTPSVPKVEGESLETTEGVMDPRIEMTEFDIAVSGCCGP